MLQKNKELTERGREQWECQELEKDAVYAANPLAKMTVEDMKLLIKENEDKITKLQSTVVDPGQLRRQVELLKDEGSRLRDEMGKLKMEKQLQEVSAATRSSRRVERAKEKKEFGQRVLYDADAPSV